MKKEEVEKLVLEKILGNRRGVNVYMSTGKLDTNAVLKNWREDIVPPSNAPVEDLWFIFIDHDPNANWEHPVEYIFINDKTKERYPPVTGSSPPDNLNELVKIL